MVLYSGSDGREGGVSIVYVVVGVVVVLVVVMDSSIVVVSRVYMVVEVRVVVW